MLGSLLFMALALAAGTIWYERSKPTARTIALIAALAGLAALGRIVFSPIPSVKPTTDIVLLTGYVLGGGPGFMVGVSAAFVANFFFGQGPWTLWQMFAWGVVGVGGGIVGKLSKRRLSRWSLAGICAASAVVFAAIVNLSFWVTFSGSHTADTIAPYYIAALPFDIAHMVGNAAFCLAFGPALVNALNRFRMRSAIKWDSNSEFSTT
jgi:energy-coupling factor transport system substrate-specific component